MQIELYAKYPFLREAGELVKSLELSLLELDKSDLVRVVKSAEKRVLDALSKGRIFELEEPEVELLSFPLALIIVKATANDIIASKYALAEALRIEEYLKKEEKEIILWLFKNVIGVEIKQGDYEYRYFMRVWDYLKRATQFHGGEWRLVNRRLRNGYVEVDLEDLVRLIREEIRSMIVSRISTMPMPTLPSSISKVVDKVKKQAIKFMPKVKVVYAPEEYPPCVARALDILKKGENLPHYGRFLLTTYLLTTGKGVDEIISIFSSAPDFKERITRYHVEHIAGLRGARVRYRVPGCKTLQTNNFCFKNDRCNDIKNPLQYGRSKRFERERSH